MANFAVRSDYRPTSDYTAKALRAIPGSNWLSTLIRAAAGSTNDKRVVNHIGQAVARSNPKILFKDGPDAFISDAVSRQLESLTPVQRTRLRRSAEIVKSKKIF